MSFSLAAWYQATPLTPEQAYHVYDQLTDGVSGAAEVSPATDGFYAAITAIYPDLDEGSGEDSPWASGIYHAADCVLLSASWSRKDEVFQTALRLARENGLVLYDPQSYELYSPQLSE